MEKIYLWIGLCSMLMAAGATANQRPFQLRVYRFNTCNATCAVASANSLYKVKGIGALNSISVACAVTTLETYTFPVCDLELSYFIDYFIRYAYYPSKYPSVLFAVVLGCQSINGTIMRLKLHNANDTVRKDILSTIAIVDCEMTLSDIGTFAQVFDLWAFTSGKDSLLVNNTTTLNYNISERAYKGLHTLGILVLDGDTAFKTMFPKLMQYKLDNMAELSLKNLSLSTLPISQLSKSMPHVQALKLSNNLFTIPPDFPWDSHALELPRNISMTRWLDLFIPGKYGSFITDDDRNKYARTLSLDYNRITDLSSYNFKGQLYMLSLNGNGLKQINPHCFRFLKDIRIIDLSENELSRIPAELFQISQSINPLVEILLHHNKIDSLSPSLFHQLVQIRKIDLSHNGLSLLRKGTFSNLYKLEVVSQIITRLYKSKMSHFPKIQLT